MSREFGLFRFCLIVGCLAILAFALPGLTLAQDSDQADSDEGEPDEIVSEEIFVTGSRIKTNPLAQRAPLFEVEEIELKRTGMTNIGATLQQLPSMGSAINQRFNVPGNSGFPQDGNGIGAGAVQLSLRNIGAKRTLVLVDGKRWVAGASASGVPSSVDLNTIPSNLIERVEVLQDGASAIYGSDAIGGVVNIITKKDFKGMRLAAQTGEFLSEGDGESTEVSALWGGGDGETDIVFSAAYFNEGAVATSDRAQSAFPNPFATSCDVPGTRCSSFTPQGRFVLGPVFGFQDMTLNDGVLNDGGANVPVFVPGDPNGGDFHAFSGADRFNYNGNNFNFLATPNERINLFTGITHDLSEQTRVEVKASYTNRKSGTKAAPEPLCLGAGCGNRINDNIVISALNPFNPFGVDLSVADGTLEFFGRRPLESGPRIFEQDVDTYFGSVGLAGDFDAADRVFAWDVTASFGENRGFQQKFNSHNAARLAVALGDPALCAATPNCVPFNFFGGQGPGGSGSITQEMLDFVTYTQRDYSEQTLFDLAGNITGDLFEMGNGANAGFAAGIEYREQDGSFQPDPIAARGETAGIPSGPTAGGFNVTEVYTELNFPLVFDKPGVNYLEVNVAGRYSDYSTSGGEDTYKLGALYQPTDELSLRGSVATGLRAPGIGELFGGAAREDFTFQDPCADVLGQFGSAAGGRDAPQPAGIIANCAALGVPVNFTQRNPQLSAVSAGNARLTAETSDSFSAGAVYAPKSSGPSAWSVSLDIYDIEIENAIQGQDPGDVINACVDTLDPFFCNLIDRTASGQINLVDNQLQNIGGIQTSGYDATFNWGTTASSGRWDVGFQASILDEYVELTKNSDGSLSSTDRTGTITDETFQRAFPELRWRSTVDWSRDRWGAGLTLRWVDEMTQTDNSPLDSILYTDAQVRYDMPFSDDLISVIFGINNLLDEDPPACLNCGVVGMSGVVHEIPGQVAYLRLVIDMERKP